MNEMQRLRATEFGAACCRRVMTMRAPVSASLRQIAESENDEGDNDAVAVEFVVLDDDHGGD